MTDIPYVVESAVMDSACAALWSGTRAGAVMHLEGPCPRCEHRAPNDRSLQITGLEAVAAGPDHLTVNLQCTCQEPHPQRPDGAQGCGRTWGGVVTGSGGDSLTVSALPATADPEVVAAALALRQAAPRQLADLRSAAEKWIAGITALYGLLGFAGITTQRSTIIQLGTGWQIGIAVASLAAISLAGWAIYWAYQAAYGWPKTYWIKNDQELLDWYRNQLSAPQRAAERLRNAVQAAGASLAALLVSAGLLWFAPTAGPAAPLIHLTKRGGAVLCGTVLTPATGQTFRLRQSPTGKIVVVPFSLIQKISGTQKC
jgi:hypothetical protein